MEHFKVWMESRSSSSISDETNERTPYYRPPPLRTCETYDDDDAFNNVALNLLSRYEGLGLTVAETISSTLIQPKDRASFFQALCARRSRSHQMSPSTARLLHSVYKTFGRTLKAMVEEELAENRVIGVGGYGTKESFDDLPPTTPRHILGPMSSGSTSSMNTSCSGRKKKKKKCKSFFPDSDAKSGGLFRSRRVQNIDWKLAAAIEHVESLCLDGDLSKSGQECNAYQPPQLS